MSSTDLHIACDRSRGEVGVGVEREHGAALRHRRGVPPAVLRRLDERDSAPSVPFIAAVHPAADQPVGGVDLRAEPARDRSGAARGVDDQRGVDGGDARVVLDVDAPAVADPFELRDFRRRQDLGTTVRRGFA